MQEAVQLVGDFCLGEEVVRCGSGAVVVTSSGKQKSIKGPQSWSLFDETKAETVADLLVLVPRRKVAAGAAGGAGVGVVLMSAGYRDVRRRGGTRVMGILVE